MLLFEKAYQFRGKLILEEKKNKNKTSEYFVIFESYTFCTSNVLFNDMNKCNNINLTITAVYQRNIKQFFTY